MGSMHTGLEEVKGGFERQAAYFGARARGGVGLIVTGGVSPNLVGRTAPLSHQLSFPWQVAKHKMVTDAVHAEGGKIALQILHAGRYAYHPLCVAPSSIKSPISKFKPRAMSKFSIKKNIWDFANCARLAQKAGYDGVEIMGSEGYLINEFIVTRTNKRVDEYGGSYQNRIRFPIEVVKAVREKVGKNFIIIYRLSMLDLVDEGSTWEEVVTLAKEIEKAGATIINTGVGWHEARIPTIATMVPRGVFSFVTKKLKGEVAIPLVSTNRINTPDKAEEILEAGHSDMVSMARPMLADPDFVVKAMEGKADQINTCIGCNQGCLDHVFQLKIATCLVNPKACFETKFENSKTHSQKKIAIVGAGPGGLSCAIEAASRGHQVTLFDSASEIGGQFNMAKKIPGKEEFHETLRYFKKQLELNHVVVQLGKTISSRELLEEGFDEIVVATGIIPRTPKIEGIDHPSVLSYIDVLKNDKPVGGSVAIIGAGGIGFDVAEFLGHNEGQKSSSIDDQAFLKEWGIDPQNEVRGGISGIEPQNPISHREIFLMQRKSSKMGKNLGKTTGWIHRANLKKAGVKMISGVSYKKIDDSGLHIQTGDSVKVLAVDSIIICAGQVSNRSLYDELEGKASVHLIGGAHTAGELDAKLAIDQGARLGNKF